MLKKNVILGVNLSLFYLQWYI